MFLLDNALIVKAIPSFAAQVAGMDDPPSLAVHVMTTPTEADRTARVEDAGTTMTDTSKEAVEAIYDNGWRVFRDASWLYIFPPQDRASQYDEEENYAPTEMVYGLVSDLISELDAAFNAGIEAAAKVAFTELAKYCKRHAKNPHHENELFQIVARMRALAKP